MHYHAVTDGRRRNDDPTGPQWLPAGTAHAVVPGTTATLCGIPYLNLWSFTGLTWESPGLTRCGACQQRA